MRTLICEFQPFFVYTQQELFECQGETYESMARRRVATRNTGYQGGTPGRHYHYAYVGPKDVKRGDWALVHNGSEFGICEIKRVVPGIDASVTKHVIEVLTRDEFQGYLDRNKEIDDLRSSMDELEFRLKEHKKLEKYEELAKVDDRAKEILTKLRDVFGLGKVQIETTSTTAGSETTPAS